MRGNQCDLTCGQTYDTDLAAKAVDWTNRCTNQHTPVSERQGAGYGPAYGQNIFFSEGRSPMDNLQTGLQSWWSEVEKHTVGAKFDFSQGAGHFTQMVWAKAKQLGCALQDCHNAHEQQGMGNWPSEDWTILVCNYNVGNVQKEDIYTVGEPCSECPSECQCKDGLCSKQ